MRERGTSTVALVRDDDRARGLGKALELIGGLGCFVNGREVLVKVNMCVAAGPEIGATCDPEVAAALIDECYRRGASKVVVADGSAVEMEEVLKLNPIREVATRHEAEFIDLDEGPHLRVRIRDGLAVDGYILSQRALEAEALINLAKLKTHSGAGITLTMKNLMGCILGGGSFDGGAYHWRDFSDRHKIHTTGFHRALVDLNTLLHPALNIIDGFTAQEGNSPFHGERVDMRIFIAGEDRVAVDATGCRAMGIEPETIGHIRLAAERGLGDIDPQVLGEEIESIRRKFRLPTHYTPHR